MPMSRSLFVRLTGRGRGERLSAMVPSVKPLSAADAARLAATATTPTAPAPAATPVPAVPGPFPAHTTTEPHTATTPAADTPTGPATCPPRASNLIEPSHHKEAVVAPGRTLLAPGRYVVTYDRLGRHGRRGTPKPMPLTTAYVPDVTVLAEAIAVDAAWYADRPGLVEALIDLQASGGHIHIGGRPFGTFTFSPATTRQPNAATAGQPVAEGRR